MERLLIIGCGDIARRALPELQQRYRVSALARARDPALEAAGVELIEGDLDAPGSLAALAGRAGRVAHLAPPAEGGALDVRTRNLVAALAAPRKSGAMLPHRFVYISTSGVYGDCGGDFVDETRALNPRTPRAGRRADAERALMEWGERDGIEVVILRVPGIYASDRLPLERLRRGTPALRAEEDGYTNHIHADDLAAILVAALKSPRARGAYNASDDSRMKMGDWFDLVADRAGLARPQRVSRVEAARVVAPELLSFMGESRRLVNRRMKEELGVRLRYPTVADGVPRTIAATA
ncbi:MAG: NAD-dependent epimerase/dehydratase family protein [Burkholderiales bacterium]